MVLCGRSLGGRRGLLSEVAQGEAARTGREREEGRLGHDPRGNPPAEQPRSSLGSLLDGASAGLPAPQPPLGPGRAGKEERALQPRAPWSGAVV